MSEKTEKKTKDTKKTDTKKAAAKEKETVKAAPKAEKEAVAETVVKEKVSEPAKAPAAPKAPEKVCVKECFIEFDGKQIKVCSLTDKALEIWKSSHKGEANSVRIYVKPEESRTYYVINETDIGSFEI